MALLFGLEEGIYFGECTEAIEHDILNLTRLEDY